MTGKLWVVVEAESRPWDQGGRSEGNEPIAVATLRAAGFCTYWMHYRDVWARPRCGNYKPRKPLVVKRGYFPPWVFVAVEDRGIRAISGEVEAMKNTPYVADVLWSEDNPHYLPELPECIHGKALCQECQWLTWAKSVRIDPKTGIVEDPVPLDAEAGLFEPPYHATNRARAAEFRPGDRVKTTGKWAKLEEMIGNRSVVKSVDGKGKIAVTHVQIWGRDYTEFYEPEQVERA